MFDNIKCDDQVECPLSSDGIEFGDRLICLDTDGIGTLDEFLVSLDPDVMLRKLFYPTGKRTVAKANFQNSCVVA